MVAQVFQLPAVHWQFAGVEQMYAKIDEGNEQQQMQWGDKMSSKQRCKLAQAKNPRHKKNQ